MVVVEIREELEGKKCGGRLGENFTYMCEILNQYPSHTQRITNRESSQNGDHQGNKGE